MKKYTFEVILYEGSDEFWESIAEKTGCDEVLDCLKEELFDWSPEIRLVTYEDHGK